MRLTKSIEFFELVESFKDSKFFNPHPFNLLKHACKLLILIATCLCSHSYLISHAQAQSKIEAQTQTSTAIAGNHNDVYQLSPVKHQLTQNKSAFSYQHQNTRILEERQTSDPSRVVMIKTAGLDYSFSRDDTYHDSSQKNNRVMQVNILKYK